MVVAVQAERFPHQVSLRSLRDEPFVMIARATSDTFYSHAISLCQAAGFAARVIQEARETFTVLNLVRAGLGVSVVPATARRMRVPGVRFYPVKNVAASWTIGMIWRKDRRELTEPFQRAVLAARRP
jgi:DNA-binding transcriptional LysR family regulator